jgi:hypothetical protein
MGVVIVWWSIFVVADSICFSPRNNIAVERMYITSLNVIFCNWIWLESVLSLAPVYWHVATWVIWRLNASDLISLIYNMINTVIILFRSIDSLVDCKVVQQHFHSLANAIFFGWYRVTGMFANAIFFGWYRVIGMFANAIFIGWYRVTHMWPVTVFT